MITAEGIARFVAETAYEDLPEAAVEQARNSLLDTLGCALAGARTAASRAALAVVAAEGAAEQATVLTAPGKAALSQAAFVNAILASVLDLDDGNLWSFAHAGAVVVPSALAAAEARGRSGRDLLTAIVIGYEVTTYAGAMLNAHHDERFYGTGAGGASGAAATVGRLLGLDAAKTAHALGIARAHMPVSPILEYHVLGPHTKETIGWGALTGAMGALLAEQGFTGPAHDLSEPLHASATRFELMEGFGERFRIIETYRKFYPACLWTHAAVEAALGLRAEHGLKPDEIAELTVATHRYAATLTSTAPTSIEAAQYCLPFVLGAALLDGELGPDQMIESRLDDPRIRALAERVRLEVDPRLDAMFPGHRAARTTIRTVDGRVLERVILVVRGTAERSMTPADVDEKFLRLAGPVVGADRAERIRGLIRRIECETDLGPLWSDLSAAPAELATARA